MKFSAESKALIDFEKQILGNSKVKKVFLYVTSNVEA